MDTSLESLDVVGGPPTLSEAVADATSVLLTGPTGDDRVRAAAVSVLSGPTPTANHVHWVTMLRSPQEVARLWSDHVGEPPVALSFVGVGEPRHSFRSADAADYAFEGFECSTARVESPSDLTTLGLRLLEGRDAPTGDCPHRLLFESLSTLLQYVPLPAAFQFVHTLHQQFSGTETTTCYHLDPTLHDTRVVRTLLSACDVRLSVDTATDELRVHRR